MSGVRVKLGVRFVMIAPAGFRMLGAIEAAARALGFDLTITSACDGVHSGPLDPHHQGEAYDIRTHGFDHDVQNHILALIMNGLRDGDEPEAKAVDGIPRSLATVKFFGFIENPGRDTEHLHVQLRKGRSYL